MRVPTTAQAQASASASASTTAQAKPDTERFLSFLVRAVCAVTLLALLALLLVPILRAETAVTSANAWHVVIAALPTSAAHPASREAKPGTINKTVYIDHIHLANTSSSAQTVTISDGQGTPGYILNSASMAANSTWEMALGGQVAIGGILWSASATSVQGSIAGH